MLDCGPPAGLSLSAWSISVHPILIAELRRTQSGEPVRRAFLLPGGGDSQGGCWQGAGAVARGPPGEPDLWSFTGGQTGPQRRPSAHSTRYRLGPLRVPREPCLPSEGSFPPRVALTRALGASSPLDKAFGPQGHLGSTAGTAHGQGEQAVGPGFLSRPGTGAPHGARAMS